VHAFQIDPINVLVRTQYMPAYSRLGPYPTAVLDRLAYDRHDLFEYFAHAAALLPIGLYPLFRWRMDAHARRFSGHGRNVAPSFTTAVLDEMEVRGPIAASDLADRGRRGKHSGGWSWNDGKRVMTWLQLSGRVAVAVGCVARGGREPRGIGPRSPCLDVLALNGAKCAIKEKKPCPTRRPSSQWRC
jgi:uncharacterized protein YcaQ